MFEAKDILTLLGIPGTKIKSLDTIEDGDEATIYIELEDLNKYFDFKFDTNGWNSIVLARLLLDKIRERTWRLFLYEEPETQYGYRGEIQKDSLPELY